MELGMTKTPPRYPYIELMFSLNGQRRGRSRTSHENTPPPACLPHGTDDDAPPVRSDWTRRSVMRSEPAWTTWATSPPLPACLFPAWMTTPTLRPPRDENTGCMATPRPPACLPTTS